MNTTTTPKGLNQAEYNALMHAIWRLDRVIKEAQEQETPPLPSVMQKLSKERDALSTLFVRIT
mgnify:FL=1|jgi:hypothetical protein